MGVLEVVLADLRGVVADLTKDDGLISASVYDTAQVLRFSPISTDLRPAEDWLLSQQQADGGWGSKEAPRARDASTLAVILALHRRQDARAKEAVGAAMDFLARQAPHWEHLPDDLPVAVELTIPKLLADAREVGLSVPDGHYSKLREIGRIRMQRLSQLKPRSRSPVAHCWETWGTEPDPTLLDARAGVGVSTAATAAWLRAAVGRPALAHHCDMARGYLQRAQGATMLGIPGVVPGIWPMERMEQQWGLYALSCAGLFSHPELADSVTMQIDDLARALAPEGIGFSSSFEPDGDCTGVTLVLLHAAGRKIDPALLKPFARDDHFITYPGERNFSYSATAHAVHAMSLAGWDITPWQQFLARQQVDGWWPQDKWHMSRFYTTTHVMLALAEHESRSMVLRSGLDALLRSQRPDGGWGTFGHSSPLETSYVAIALDVLRKKGLEQDTIRAAQRLAYRRLLEGYKPFSLNHCLRETMWIGKELYCPPRMDRPYELSAIALLAMAEANGEL